MPANWIGNWISALALAVSATSATDSSIHGMLDLKDVEQVHQYAREILEQCPWPECQIVSLGPTNTLIDSFLRYYLGNKAEEAIHYVPLRGLRSAIQEPIWMERTLPPRSSPAKRVLLVRTLEMGATMDEYERVLAEYLNSTGRELEIGGYFMVSSGYERLEASRRAGLAWSGRGRPNPNWSRILRPLQVDFRVVKGSYREVDKFFYRYEILSSSSWSAAELWTNPHRLYLVGQLRQKLARSVGLDSRPGPKFELSETELASWRRDLGALPTPEEALTLFGLGLLWRSEEDSAFKREFERIIAEQFKRDDFQFTKNPRYLELDGVIREYIESPIRFKAKNCAARVTGAS